MIMNTPLALSILVSGAADLLTPWLDAGLPYPSTCMPGGGRFGQNVSAHCAGDRGEAAGWGVLQALARQVERGVDGVPLLEAFLAEIAAEETDAVRHHAEAWDWQAREEAVGPCPERGGARPDRRVIGAVGFKAWKGLDDAWRAATDARAAWIDALPVR